MNAGKNKVRINPRSTGNVSKDTYEKHTLELSLKPEAMELARCRDMGIQTPYVQAAELLRFDESENRLTTKKIHGTELFHTVWNPTYLLGRLKGNRLNNMDAVVKSTIEVGVWLRKYHTSSIALIHKSADGSWMQSDFERNIRQIRENTLLSEKTLGKVAYTFGKELEKLSQNSYLQENGSFACQVHGDFVLYNMLIDPQNKIHVLDFGDTRVSGNLEDVARFYSSIWAIAQTNKTRQQLFGTLPNQFLAAYGLPQNIVDNPYFRVNLVYNFLTHLKGQFYMRDLLSWNSNREMSQITNAGMKWVYQQI